MLNFFAKGEEKRSRRLAYVGLALVLAILYDYFFWESERGIGSLIFTAAYVGGFLLLAFVFRQVRNYFGLLLFVPALIMSFTPFLYHNAMVQFGVPIFVFIFGFLAATVTLLQNPHKHQFRFLRIPFFRSIDLPFLQWGQLYKDLFHFDKLPKKELLRKILIGVGLALPLLFVFTYLFAKSDQIFANSLSRVFDFDLEPSTVFRIIRVGVLTLLASSFFYLLISKYHALQDNVFPVRKLDSVTVGVVLGLVNLLFLSFVFIQLRYFFGGAEFVFSNDITFADYSRQGFFELVRVMVLAAVLILYSYRSFVHHGSHAVIKSLQMLLIVQVGVVAISALRRMYLYQEVFGLTVLRLYVEWFIYFVLAILVLALVNIVLNWAFHRFFYAAAILGTIALTVVTMINVDYMIAEKNVNRFLTSGKTLDVEYLSRLSSDAAPAFLLLPASKLNELESSGEYAPLLTFIDRVQAQMAARDRWVEKHLSQYYLDMSKLSAVRAEIVPVDLNAGVKN